jgi:hypothetical protein
LLTGSKRLLPIVDVVSASRIMTVLPRTSTGEVRSGWPYRFSESEPGAYAGFVYSWSEALSIAHANEAKLWPVHPRVRQEMPFSPQQLKAG